MSTSTVVIHYEEALYQVYAPLPSPLPLQHVNTTVPLIDDSNNRRYFQYAT